MRKVIALFLILSLCGVILVGCGEGKNRSIGNREISPSGTTDEDPQNDSLEANSDHENQSSDAQDLDEGTISSLDEIKQNAISEGFEITELVDMQRQATSEMMEGFVDGFNVVIGDKHIPVLEFTTPNVAQAYADMTNEGGYNVAIVNGRFFTCVGANKGIIEDDEEQAVLERIMDAKAQIQEHWSDTKGASVNTSDYKSAYALQDDIKKSMSTLLEQALTKNNKAHPEGDPNNTEDVIPLMFGSIAMGFTAYFGEDETYYEGIASTAEMIGITDGKVTRNAAHNYTLSGKEPRDKLPYEINGMYDPATGSLRMVERTDGKITEFFEFIPLGNDQYAFQTDEERAIVIYKNGELESFSYTKISNYNTNLFDDPSIKYDGESDSIYPTGVGANTDWVLARGEDSYAEYYAFNGTTIKISYETFNGRVKVEIPA